MVARRTITVGVAGALLAAAAVLACNPLFKIVQREQGPTFCEQAAQAQMVYCDDFDRVSATTVAEESAVTFGGNTQVTSAVASSLPNSLAVMSDGGLAGKLATLPDGLGDGGVQCQLDLFTADFNDAIEAGVTLGAMGLGSSMGASGGSPGLNFVFVQIGQGPGEVVLVSVGASGVGMEIPGSCPVAGPEQDGGMRGIPGGLNAWTGLSYAMVPFDLPDGGEGGDGGLCSLTGNPGAHPWKMQVTSGPINLGTFLVPSEQFASPTLMAYGAQVQAQVVGFTIRVDNARCRLIDSLP
jgi:hypothetical protein